MTSQELRKAREYEAVNVPLVPEQERPAFHVTAGIGWMNDPNGFSVYRGEYHLFYQYYPYSTHWGLMHWGHMKSKDFIKWERLPVALAPDREYDRDGCFSGGAAELPDGRQLLIYTGVRKESGKDGEEKQFQTQCLAIGDGVNYEKYESNPVISEKDIPAGGSIVDFRDPKIWREPDGSYRVVTVNDMQDGGAVLLYKSPDGFSWEFDKIIDKSRGQYGEMWECPDYFILDGWRVLIVSPLEPKIPDPRFPNGHGVLCLTGHDDLKTGDFVRESVQAVDKGFNFYAPQTMETPDGRRVMIAWMRKWSDVGHEPTSGFFSGEMILPRELSIKDGKLIQNPVRELENYRTAPVVYQNILIENEISLDGIHGGAMDLILRVKSHEDKIDKINKIYKYFQVCVAKDGAYKIIVQYRPERDLIYIKREIDCKFENEMKRESRDASLSGVREIPVSRGDDQNSGEIKLRMIIDRYSIELFVNDGEQAASILLYAPDFADSITFEADGGKVLLDVEKYDLAVL